MDATQDFKSLQEKIQKALIATTRTAGQVSSEDLAFQRSLNPEVGPAIDEQSQRLLSLASALIKSAVSISELEAPVLEDGEDVENNWRSVVDVVDSLLEKSDTCLDEYTGVIKRTNPTHHEQAKAPPKAKKQFPGNAFRTQNLMKPQLNFQTKPNNSETATWKPILSNKPHATLPLEDSLTTFTSNFDQEQYKHPYETEVSQHKYPDAVYQNAEPIPYLPVDTTSAIFVDTEEGVMEMLEELKAATEIAIDLEHHDTRSYVGLVSLMQISTRHKDWVVDTLKPWRQKLEVLNEVFTDPSIVKVFHGAYMDIVWLQRDLGLYVVGLFDTHWASRTLGYAGGSLAFLLKKFVDFDADKQYQLADWRIRPLPEEMFFYARADTHFLLYIYDMMRNELIDKSTPGDDRVGTVLQKSKETSLLRFERQVYNEESGRGPGGWYNLLVKTPALFNNEQFMVFRAVHSWRDKTARADDDSTAFIMPNHVVLSIAKIMPMDMKSLSAVSYSILNAPKARAEELLEVIKSAKAQGVSGPSMIDVLRPDTFGVAAKANLPNVAEQTSAKTMLAVVNGSELRSESSSFWGSAFGSSMWDGPKTTQNDNLRLAVPLPALSSELFTSTFPSEEQQRASMLKEEAMAVEDHIPFAQRTPAEEDPAFVIKRGAKRKSEQISEDEASEDDEICVDADEPKAPRGHFQKMTRKAQNLKRKEDKRARKEQREEQWARERAVKQAAKAAKKAAKAQQEGHDVIAEMKMEVEGEGGDGEAFDYSKAESVLNGKKKKDGGGGGGEVSGKNKNKKKKKKEKEKAKPFDPYSKSGNAPKGMRRVQSERAGKSHTFKS